MSVSQTLRLQAALDTQFITLFSTLESGRVIVGTQLEKSFLKMGGAKSAVSDRG